MQFSKRLVKETGHCIDRCRPLTWQAVWHVKSFVGGAGDGDVNSRGLNIAVTTILILGLGPFKLSNSQSWTLSAWDHSRGLLHAFPGCWAALSTHEYISITGPIVTVSHKHKILHFWLRGYETTIGDRFLWGESLRESGMTCTPIPIPCSWPGHWNTRYKWTPPLWLLFPYWLYDIFFRDSPWLQSLRSRKFNIACSMCPRDKWGVWSSCEVYINLNRP